MHPRDRPLRVGIVGAGWVAVHRHLPIYRRRAATQVIAICDQQRECAEDVAGRYGIAIATDSVAALLSHDLDLVSICTPPFAHRDAAIAALRAGCHVFLEKPMAMHSTDAAAIAAAARTSGRLLCVSHNFLFSRSMRRLRDVLDSGTAGPIRFVIGLSSSSPARRLPVWYGQLPGGLFFDESPHLLYLIGALLGPPELLGATAMAGMPDAEQSPRSVHAVLASGTVPATVTMVFDAPISEWHLVVVCERRVLMVDLFRDIAVVLGSDDAHRARDILKTSLTLGMQHLRGFATSGARLTTRRQYWGHDTLINLVIDAIREGRPSPVPIEDALHVVRLTDEILRAIG